MGFTGSKWGIFRIHVEPLFTVWTKQGAAPKSRPSLIVEYTVLLNNVNEGLNSAGVYFMGIP